LNHGYQRVGLFAQGAEHRDGPYRDGRAILLSTRPCVSFPFCSCLLLSRENVCVCVCVCVCGFFLLLLLLLLLLVFSLFFSVPGSRQLTGHVCYS